MLAIQNNYMEKAQRVVRIVEAVLGSRTGSGID